MKTISIRDTDREMNEVLNQLEELQEENSKLQDQLSNITQANEELKDQLAALIESLNAPKETVLTLDSVTDAKYNGNVTITGMLISDEGVSLSGQTIVLSVNGENVNVKTKNGEFSYVAVFKTIGEQEVTAVYEGNSKYEASEDSIQFTVNKQDVIVTVNPIEDTSYGDNVTITGKFTDANGKAISNSNVRVFVNGKKYLARTDKTGTYTLDAPVTVVGENTVSVGYAGNDNYNSYEDITTFNVEAQDVIVTVNPIEEVAVGDNVTITGTFTDKYGKAIVNSNVKILINGKKYYAKTDSTGAYTFTATVTTEGTNNITAAYSGSAKYNAYETSTTFIAKVE